MLNIKLDDKHRLTSDEKQYILQRDASYKHKETGELITKWKSLGYFNTISGALSDTLRRDILSSDATTLQELKEVTENAYNRLSKLVEPYESPKVA